MGQISQFNYSPALNLTTLISAHFCPPAYTHTHTLFIFFLFAYNIGRDERSFFNDPADCSKQRNPVQTITHNSGITLRCVELKKESPANQTEKDLKITARQNRAQATVPYNTYNNRRNVVTYTRKHSAGFLLKIEFRNYTVCIEKSKNEEKRWGRDDVEECCLFPENRVVLL